METTEIFTIMAVVLISLVVGIIIVKYLGVKPSGD